MSQTLNSSNNVSIDDNFEKCDPNKENTDSSLDFSEILFTDDSNNWSGLHFAMKPCLERRTVRTLIERGGGFMSSNKYSEKFINLVTIDANLSLCQKSDQKYYYSTFVYDSCKENQLKDLNNYLIPKTTTIQMSSDTELVQNEDQIPRDATEKTSEEPTSEQLMQTNEDSDESTEETEQMSDNHEIDLKILDFIGRRKAFADIEGTRLWTKAFEDGVQFGLTWKSTKDRFFDQIMPNIDNYSIEESLKNKFIHYFNLFVEKQNKISESTQTQEITDAEQISDQRCEENWAQDNVSESDVEIDVESDELTSKYFKSNERFLYRRKPKTEPKKKYFNAYLDFMKQRETTNTPENLMRIRQALKVSIEDKKDKNDPKAIDKSFGAKVVAKTRDETIGKESEKGMYVSDISSDDDSDGHQKQRPKEKSERVVAVSVASNKMYSKTTNNSYSLTEDESILGFVLKTKRFEELKGKTIWEEAENKDICLGRSWQSMKERFRKHIMPQIDSYDITLKDKQRLKIGYYTERTNESRGASGAYTREEDLNILQYIIRHNRFDVVKGNTLWHQMEEEFKRKKLRLRTWQSLKERYLKRIVPQLYKYGITLESSKKILSSMTGFTEKEKQLIFNKCKNSFDSSKAKRIPLDITEDKNKQNCDEKSESDSQTETNDKNKKQESLKPVKQPIRRSQRNKKS